MMVFFMDKVFVFILLLACILSIPLSILVFSALIKESLDTMKDSSNCDFSVIIKSILFLVMVIIIIIGIAFVIGACFIIIKLAVALLSHKIIFFNI